MHQCINEINTLWAITLRKNSYFGGGSRVFQLKSVTYGIFMNFLSCQCQIDVLLLFKRKVFLKGLFKPVYMACPISSKMNIL